jgi:uncharacterized protein
MIGWLRATASKTSTLRPVAGLALAASLLAAPAFAHDERNAPPHLPFYVATRDGQTIYLLGTLHVGEPADYPPYQPFRPVIVDALTRSSTLAFELSPDDIVAAEGNVSNDGVCARPCLQSMLPPALWVLLRERLRHDPATLAQMRMLKPWLADLLLEGLAARRAGLQTEYGTELQIENIYLRGPIKGLESIDEQMRAFTGLSLAEQWEMLAEDLTQTPEQDVADVRTLHALWLAGDADKLYAWQSEKTAQLAHAPELAHALDERTVLRRNRRFVVRALLLATPGKPIFVAVGVLHLGGPGGMLALLRGYGFRVMPG